MIRFVYFDLGNTVIDYHRGPVTEEEKEDLGLELVRKQLRSWGFPVSWERLKTRFWKPWTNDLYKKGIDSDKELNAEEYLSRAVGSDEPDFPALINLYHEPARRYARPMGDIRELLGELEDKEKGAGIISNTPIHGLCHDETLERLGLLGYFKHRFYSYDEGLRKPDREIFRRAGKRTGLDWDEILMVGDSYRADVQVPMELGMKAVLYDPSGLFAKAPCRRVARFREIGSFLD